MDHKDEFGKWMNTIESAFSLEKSIDTHKEDHCNCDQWGCKKCFPDVQGNESPLSNGEANLSEDDTLSPDEMIKKMDYMQQAGLSKSSKNINPSILRKNPESLKTEYSKVMGDISEENNTLPVEQFEVYDKKTGEKVGGPYTSRSRARRVVDKKDNEYGAYRYGMRVVKPVSEEAEEGAPSQGQGAGTLGATGGNAAGPVTTSSKNTGNLQYSQGTAPTMPESTNKGKTMENVDKDVAAMLNTLKKYDKLNESVLGMTNVGGPSRKLEEDERKQTPAKANVPAALRKEKGGDWKVSKKDLDDEEKKSLTYRGKVDEEKEEKKADKLPPWLKDKEEKVDEDGIEGQVDEESEKVDESADTDTLNWMKRFAKLGNMTGYTK